MTKPTAGSRTRGIDRAVEIIDFLAETGEPLRPSDIAKGIGAPKSSIYQLVNVLTSLRVLELVGTEGYVFLGKRINFWGVAYLKNFDLTRIATPHLENLSNATGEMTQLCALDGNKYVVMMMSEGKRAFRISADVGRPVPIPWTASGRLLLEGMDAEKLRAFIPEDDFELPDGSLITPTALADQISKAVQDNFFSFDSITDNYTHCFAAPIRDSMDKAIACVCIVAPKIDASNNHAIYRAKLLETAQKIEDEIR